MQCAHSICSTQRERIRQTELGHEKEKKIQKGVVNGHDTFEIKPVRAWLGVVRRPVYRRLGPKSVVTDDFLSYLWPNKSEEEEDLPLSHYIPC